MNTVEKQPEAFEALQQEVAAAQQTLLDRIQDQLVSSEAFISVHRTLESVAALFDNAAVHAAIVEALTVQDQARKDSEHDIPVFTEVLFS